MADPTPPYAPPAVGGPRRGGALGAPARLAVLEATGLLVGPVEAFERAARLAGRGLRAPLAQVNLLTGDAEVPKAVYADAGAAVDRARQYAAVPLDRSYCRQVVEAGAPLVVDDARTHPLVRDCPATREVGVAAYVGVPLRVPAGPAGAGTVLGTVCAVDFVPRRWTAADVELLEDVAAGAAAELGRRLHAESALAASEARYRALVDQAADPIFLCRGDGALVDVNQAACDTLGYRRDELLALQIGDVASRDPAVLRALFARVLAGETLTFDGSNRRKDGSAVPVEVRLGPVRAGAEPHVLAITRDLSEGRRAEAALRDSERRFRTLFAHAADAISIHDAAGRLLDANERLCELVGYTRDELLAPGVADRAVGVPAADLPRLWDGAAPGTTLTLEGVLRHRSGETVPVENRVAAVGDGAARVFYVLLRDVRERRALESQLRQSQKMEAVGQLAGGIAHDFNNLLHVIEGHARLALDGLPGGGGVREDLEAVQDAAGRAARLTRQLLAFSRKQVLRPEVLDLNAVVRGVEPLVRRLIGEDIAVVTRLAPALGAVTADPAQLEQVLVNLALNARDAMPRGGRLVIATDEVELGGGAGDGPGEAAAPGPYVRLTVADTGAGMDEATRARLFEPFFTTKPLGKGTGLGLSTVYGIVRQSGGHVWATSAPGAGATFAVALPRSGGAAPAGAPGAPAAAPEAARGAGTVLLVEDEAAVRRLVRRMLERQGYAVLEAGDGDAALRLFAGGADVDLVVTDVVMPGLSGRALAERIAAERPGTRVMFMSGYTDDEIFRRGLAVPGAVFLAKPFTRDELLDAVRTALGSRAGPT